jgi:hypothetical protein
VKKTTDRQMQGDTVTARNGTNTEGAVPSDEPGSGGVQIGTRQAVTKPVLDTVADQKRIALN